MKFAFPQCRKCGEGVMVPLSEFGPGGASIRYKAWVCIQPMHAQHQDRLWGCLMWSIDSTRGTPQKLLLKEAEAETDT
jgi:hypothetical protein